jgi:hypothetical protein
LELDEPNLGLLDLLDGAGGPLLEDEALDQLSVLTKQITHKDTVAHFRIRKQKIRCFNRANKQIRTDISDACTINLAWP